MSQWVRREHDGVTAEARVVDLGPRGEIATGVCFLDHMIDQLTAHAQLGVSQPARQHPVSKHPASMHQPANLHPASTQPACTQPASQPARTQPACTQVNPNKCRYPTGL